MNIETAKEKVEQAFPKYSVKESYSGVIADEDIFAFVISNGAPNRVIAVYSDGDMNEINGPMASILINSLRRD